MKCSRNQVSKGPLMHGKPPGQNKNAVRRDKRNTIANSTDAAPSQGPLQRDATKCTVQALYIAFLHAESSSSHPRPRAHNCIGFSPISPVITVDRQTPNKQAGERK